ncbi:hypothetical protein [Pontixanthobacter luteolus]|uniref:hypothetical protein n=1 Tax=Pontixanthobacter luteolus TaxID=295089 RepID=UPI0023042D0B|nr:hypothetical protein [Pontixanthobacter luteolus]
MKKLILTLALIAGLIGFAIATGLADSVVEWRVRSALVENGIGEKRAECMAARMTDRLSVPQLLKLRNMEAQDGEPESPTGIRDFLRRVDRIGDAEVVAVTGSSAALCAIGIG